jgi:molybdopterin converting factor subunit 1
MRLTILFFGVTSDIAQATSKDFQFEKPVTIAELKSFLKKEYAGLKNINDFALAINEAYANDDDILKSGDIVAIIPPVSGG